MVIAKDEFTHAGLCEQFKEHTVPPPTPNPSIFMILHFQRLQQVLSDHTDTQCALHWCSLSKSSGLDGQLMRVIDPALKRINKAINLRGDCNGQIWGGERFD